MARIIGNTTTQDERTNAGTPGFALPPPVPDTAPAVRPDRIDVAGMPRATTREWTPTQRAVNADTETVQGQLRSVLDAGGPLMERAVARSNEMMNARGLLNSSMASTSALDAMLGQGLQIAGPDAQTYSAASRDNWTAANQAGQFNAGEFNLTDRFNVGEANQIARFNAAAENEFLGRIQGAGLERDRMREGATLDAARAAQGAGLELDRMREGATLERARAEHGAGLDLGRMREGATLERARAEHGAGLELDRMREGATLERARAEQNALIQANHARLSSQLDTASRERLMAIEQNYRTLTNSSGQAAQAVSQMQQDIGRILADPNIAQENKQGLIDRIIQNTNSALRTIGVIHGVDYGNLLNFGGGPSAPTPAPAPAPEPAPAPAPTPVRPDGEPWWTRNPLDGVTGGGN